MQCPPKSVSMLIAPRSHFASGIHEKFCCPTTFSEGLAGSIECPGVIHSGSEMEIPKALSPRKTRSFAAVRYAPERSRESQGVRYKEAKLRLKDNLSCH